MHNCYKDIALPDARLEAEAFSASLFLEATEKLKNLEMALKELATKDALIATISDLENQVWATKAIMPFDDAAIYMGVSEDYLNDLAKTKRITHFNPHASHIFFERAELDRWMVGQDYKDYISNAIYRP